MNKIVLLIVIICFVQAFSFTKSFLSRKVYNLPTDSVSYKYGVDIEILENDVFVLENRSHRIFKYTVNNGIKFVKTIGQRGKGPSDLFLPMELSIWNNILAVKDEVGVSFFDKNGKFLGKFRLFSPRISFTYANDKIFMASANPESDNLIRMYNRKGKSLMNFGKKFLDLKPIVNKRFNHFLAERYFFSGKLLSDGTFVYYLSSKFGKIIKYNTKGQVVMEGELPSALGDKGKRIVSINKEMAKSGAKMDRDNAYPVYKLFHDAFFCKGKIYLLITNINDPKPDSDPLKDRTSYIVVVDPDSLKPGEKYALKLGKDERIHSFAVTERRDKPVFYISMYTEEGTEIVAYNE
jgi:hypothetical protein